MSIATLAAELRLFNHHAAAKALETLAAKYEAERHCNLTNTAELHRADRLVGELRDALRPFAAYVDTLPPIVTGAERLTDAGAALSATRGPEVERVVTFGDLRSAREVWDRTNATNEATSPEDRP